jgi:ankyrin repeat protein
LIEAGANVNIPNVEGSLPIHFAVRQWPDWDFQEKLLDMLVARGADLEAQVHSP